MAVYGLKYYFEYSEAFLSQRVHRIEILEANFTGSATEKNLASPPDEIKYKITDEELESPIRGSELVIYTSAETDFEFIEFFTNDARRYIVKKYIDSELIWQGFIQPELHTEPYLPPPYNLSLHATDGLADLKNYTYAPVEYPLTDNRKNTIIDVIVSCLKPLTDYFASCSIYESCYFYEYNTTRDITNSPLSQLWVGYEIFKDSDGNYMTCYEVFEQVLTRFHLYVIARGNVFYILQINTLKDDTNYSWRRFSRSGNYLGLVDYTSPIALTNADAVDSELNCFVDNNQSLSFKPAWKEYVIEQDFGFDKTINHNPEVLNFAQGWDYTNPYIVNGESRNGDKYTQRFGVKTYEDYTEISSGPDSYANHFIEQPLGYINYYAPPVRNTSGISANYEALLKLTVSIYADIIYSADSRGLGYQIILEGATDTYTLNTAGEWENNSIIRFIKIDLVWRTNIAGDVYTKPGTFEYELSAIEAVPISGNLKLRIYSFDKSPYIFKSVDLSYNVINSSSNYPTSDTVTTTINERNNKVGKNSFIIGDLPNLPNNQLVFDGGLFWSSDGGTSFTPTLMWTRLGEDNQATLNELIADDVATSHVYPLRMLEGTLRCHFNNLTRVVDNSKHYMILGATVNGADNEWKVTLLEMRMGGSFLKLKNAGNLRFKSGGRIKLKN